MLNWQEKDASQVPVLQEGSRKKGRLHNASSGCCRSSTAKAGHHPREQPPSLRAFFSSIWASSGCSNGQRFGRDTMWPPGGSVLLPRQESLRYKLPRGLYVCRCPENQGDCAALGPQKQD